MDRYALTCPCTCHGRGSHAQCDPAYPNGCGHLHRAAPSPGATGSTLAATARPANGCACPACHRPVADAALCTCCTGHLTSDLNQVPSLAEELEITRAKLDRIGGRDPRGGSTVPLGYRPMAAEVADVLHLSLASVAREVCSAAALPLYDVPAESPALLAAWLQQQRETIRHHIEAARLAEEIGYAVRVTRRAIDRPADRLYAGPCDTCRADLYAGARSATTDCRECGATYTVPERRAWLLVALREHLATAAEIAAGVGSLYGQPVNRKTINQWHHRERLVDHGVTRTTHQPLFRIGDVLDLAAERAATRLTADAS